MTQPPTNDPALWSLRPTLFAVGGIAYYNTRLSQGVEFAMSLGPGWNLANTLDTYGLGRDAGEPAVYETYWGSAPASPARRLRTGGEDRIE